MVKAGGASGFAKSEACNVAEGCGLDFLFAGGGGTIRGVRAEGLSGAVSSVFISVSV